MFSQVIINNQGVLFVITEVFTHSRTRIRRKVQHSSRVRWTSSYDDSLFHDTFALEPLLQRSNFRSFLTNSDVNVNNSSFLLGLVNHRVNGNGSFTGLTVTNDQLTLTTADWYHGVNSYKTGHKWLIHTLTVHNTWGRVLHTAHLLVLKRRATIKWVTKWVNYTANQFWANWYFKYTTSQTSLSSGTNFNVFTK